MNAIKTEYKEFVFDSKSEAVFARALDLSGAAWVYHPGVHGGHDWDFLVFPQHTYRPIEHFWVGDKAYWAESPPRPCSKPMLVEYKPSMPTNTYVDNLTEAMRNAFRQVESVVVWGNPWDGVDNNIDPPQECCYRVYPIFSSHDSKYGWGNFCRLGDNGGDWPTSTRHDITDVLGIEECHAQQAKNYRFDLLMPKTKCVIASL